MLPRYHQAIPVFVDVDPETFTIDPDDMEARITSRTRAVMVVHLHGLPADMHRVAEVAMRHELVVIEDAARYRLRLDPVEAGVDLSVRAFRKAIQDAVSAEGVPLTEYQNRPLPGQVLSQRRVGYGRGCPWTCVHTTGEVTYQAEDFPRTLDVIRSSLLIGRRLCMASLLRRENVGRVGGGFTTSSATSTTCATTR